MLDSRGIPTCICPECNGKLFIVLATFDPETYMISGYNLDIQCHGCGSFATAPTPENHPNNLNNGNK